MSVVFLVATALGLPVHLHRRGDHHHALSEHSHLRDLESQPAHHHHHARSKHPHFRSLESEAHGLPSETMTRRQRAEKNLHGLAVFLSLHAAEQRGEDLERFVPTADADFERLDDHELKSTELELLRSFYLDALAAKVRPHHAWADLEKADPDEYHRELKRVEASAHIPKHLGHAELRGWFLDAERSDDEPLPLEHFETMDEPDGDDRDEVTNVANVAKLDMFDSLQAAMSSLTKWISEYSVMGHKPFAAIGPFSKRLATALSTASEKVMDTFNRLIKPAVKKVKEYASEQYSSAVKAIELAKTKANEAYDWAKNVGPKKMLSEVWNFMWATLSIFERKIMRRARHMAEAEVVR